jgi:hypothetical protein
MRTASGAPYGQPTGAVELGLGCPESRREERPTMKALSEQLTDLAARSKKTEDVVAAARDKNRAELESQRDKLKTSIADGNTKAHERAASLLHLPGPSPASSETSA